MKEHTSSTISPTDSNGRKSGSDGQRRWIGVDLDGTLCEYTTWAEMGVAIGKPVMAMVERIRRWLSEGKYDVKIFTARACDANWNRDEDFIAIKAICRNLFGRELEITNVKDFAMCQLWDDRCVTVGANTGYREARSGDMFANNGDPLSGLEEIKLMPGEAREDMQRNPLAWNHQ